MKRFAILILLLAGLTGCETAGQRMADLKAEEETSAARQALSLAGMEYNLGQCEEHQHIDIGHHNTAKWRKFAKDHHMDGYPMGISDKDLKDCLENY